MIKVIRIFGIVAFYTNAICDAHCDYSLQG